jgi:UDP-2,3-diacylglucosamine pyrophosphatase LpxH
MLVIFSDIHLTDGSTCANIGPDAFSLLTDRLRDMAYRASWRSDGSYRPIEGIDLILAGDIFDYLHSTQWAEGTPGPGKPVRPWDDPASPAYQEVIAGITEGILRHNAASLALIKRLGAEQAISIPSTPSQQNSGRFSARVHIPTRVYFMCGNHDWYLHLPGAAYDAVRGKICAAMGLANPPNCFPHAIEELPALERLCRDYGVYVRHGDFYDAYNFDRTRGRNAAALGDAVSVGLIDRFPAVVQAHMGNELPDSLLCSLREVVNVRPALYTPAWIHGLLERECQADQAKRIKSIWDDLADQLVREPFVRGFDQKFALDIVDGLETALFFSRHASLGLLSNLTKVIGQRFGLDSLSWAKHAVKEPAYLDRTARYIVYGHTHSPELVPLNVYLDHGTRVNQACFNTGTWHIVHSPARGNPDAPMFMGYNLMSYIAFFKGDERRGKPFETWTGSLAWE